MHDVELGRSLVAIARRAIGSELGEHGNVGSDRAQRHRPHPALEAPGATFVTLLKHGMLRGCIGTIEANRALGVDVSLLSSPEAMTADDEPALLLQLRPGIDGVVLSFAGRRATFLPQVWDTLQEPAVFLAELKRKAGLPVDFWSAGMKVSRYGVTKWRERDLRRVEKIS